MTERERSLEEQLGAMMSEISENCWHAGWLEGTEYMVPELCRRALSTGKPQPWANGTITPDIAQALTDLAERLGHWVNLNDDGKEYVPFFPDPIPPRYVEDLDHWLHHQRS